MSSYLYRTKGCCMFIDLGFYVLVWMLNLYFIDDYGQVIQAVDKAMHVPALIATYAVYDRIFQDQFWGHQAIQLSRLRYRQVV